MFFAVEDQRELLDAVRLHKRHYLEQFIQRTKPARHVDKPEAVLHETNFAGKKVVKIDRQIRVFVAALFKRQLDVQSDRRALALCRALVRGLHDSRAAAGDHRHAGLRQFFTHVHRRLVGGVARLGSGGAKNRHGGVDARKLLKRVNELSHDSENSPRILSRERGLVLVGDACHGSSVTARH